MPNVWSALFLIQNVAGVGGSSKTLSETVESSSFRCTASVVAGRNSQVPIYFRTDAE